MPMETMVEALKRLEGKGYRDEFRAQGDGLRALGTGRVYPPESLTVEETVRFEGPSNPGDEAVVFALRAPDGALGTYTVAYGPSMDALDAELVPRLRTSRP